MNGDEDRSSAGFLMRHGRRSSADDPRPASHVLGRLVDRPGLVVNAGADVRRAVAVLQRPRSRIQFGIVANNAKLVQKKVGLKSVQ
jgi:hypothetical protein